MGHKTSPRRPKAVLVRSDAILDPEKFVCVRDAVAEIVGVEDRGLVPGAKRAGGWPRVRKAHLAKEPTCAFCGATEHVEVHHVLPFHIFPDRELDPDNLITLCRAPHDCHGREGHLGGDFRRLFNPAVKEIASLYRMLVRAARSLADLAKREQRTGRKRIRSR